MTKVSYVWGCPVTTVVDRLKWNSQDGISLLVLTKCISRIFRNLALRSGQILTSPIISLWKNTFLRITCERMNPDGWNWHHRTLLVRPRHLICILLTVTWSDLDLRSNADLDLLRSTWVYFDSSRREKRNERKIVALRWIGTKIFPKNHKIKIGVWPLWTLTSGD